MKKSEIDKQAERESTHWWFRARRGILEALLERSQLKANGNVLEIGAATGGNFSVCSRFGHYHALDISGGALLHCRDKGIERLVQADAQHLPFQKEQFDAVIAYDILEHLSRDELSLSEISRILRKDGVLQINVPAFQKLYSSHDQAFDHIRRYQPGEMEKKLKSAGFEIEFKSYWSFFIFPAIFVYRILFNKTKDTDDPKSDFELKLPIFVDWVLSSFSGMEVFLIRRGVTLPFGVSFACIARKSS